jgi:SAM-dependent methyltransferase
VHEILRSLPDGARVLDLGCASGSFDHQAYPLVVIALDAEPPAAARPRHFVRGDAAQLPFASGSFDAIISNHSLEHFTDLDAALAEAGRVLKHPGKVYVAVPDSRTLTDWLYRSLARGGGHVNAFASRDELIAKIRRHILEPLAAVRPLGTSLSFLNRRNHPSRPPRRLWLIGGGNETVLVWLTHCLRIVDRALHTRLSLYGWALFFGEQLGPIREDLWPNVCVRCGAGHPTDLLMAQDCVRKRRWFGRIYHCPGCGARNVFTSSAN